MSTMTIKEYTAAYLATPGATETNPGLYFTSGTMTAISATVFSTAFQAKFRNIIRYMYSDVVLNFDVTGMTVQEIATYLNNKLSAAANMKIGKWEAKLRAISALAGLSDGDLTGDYYKTLSKTGSEKDQMGGTLTITGTTRRNSFNSSDMADTAGSTTTTTDTTHKTHSFTDRVDTEQGNNRSKAEIIKAFYDSADAMDFVGEVVNFFMLQIGSMVY